jgi:glucose/arabinose dehydrogenase
MNERRHRHAALLPVWLMAAVRAFFRLPHGALVALAAALGVVPAHAQYQLEPAFPGLGFVSPTDIQRANDGTDRMFVVEKRGVIWVFPADYTVQGSDAEIFLDLRGEVRTSGEAGLLGLAFHPGYETNGTLFTFYISSGQHTIVSRWQVSSDPNAADPESEVVLIDAVQPTLFHNGGQLAFGNDGYLYISMGDNRTNANAQDLTTLPGSILRIDVDPDPPVPTPPYTIPPDNPFIGSPAGARPEIYAYGFRNPWRFWHDPGTGELFVCDVGEADFEEIDLVHGGENHGWPLMEGPACFPAGVCDTTGRDLRLPLYSYSHAEGRAIVGGCRYQGLRLPELTGVFVFADYTAGKVWGLHYDGAGIPERFDLVTHEQVMLTVGQGFRGEVLMGALDGQIYRLGRASTPVGGLTPSARLLGSFPNPFHPSTTIRFTLDRSAAVRLDIVTVRGERVRRFELAAAGAGAHEVVWRGETDAGTRVASGVYFCRLVVDGTAMGATRIVRVQ